MEANVLTEKICGILKDRKGENVVAINVGEKSSVADYFVIASGRSTTHTRSLVERVEEELEKEGVSPKREEGVKEGRRAVIDYGDGIALVSKDETLFLYQFGFLWR